MNFPRAEVPSVGFFMYYDHRTGRPCRGQVSRSSSVTRKDARNGAWIAIFVLPGLTIVAVIILLPLFMSLFNSLFSWNQLLRGDFIGLGNFRRMFLTEPYRTRFFNALGNNAKWFLVTMLVQNSLGLFFGYLLSRKVAGP